MTTTKAVISVVNFLGEDVEMLMLPNGTFGIAASQFATIFQFDRNQASRSIKRLLGAGFQFDRLVSELNPAPVNVLLLPDFEKAIVKLAYAGDVKARAWNEASVGLTFTQLAHDAFNIRFEKEERQAWLRQREQHKQQFHPLLTRWMQADGVKGKGYGKAVNLFKAHAGVPLSYVGDYSADDLQKLNTAEIRYDVLRNVGFTHEMAIQQLR
jgi:hypothetical protein